MRKQCHVLEFDCNKYMDPVIAPTIDTAAIARQLLLVVLTVSFGLVLRVAHDWYPFTPTFTSEKKWFAGPDIFRWVFSGIFLFIIPFAYIAVVLVYVSKNPIYIPLSMPTLRETVEVLGLFSFGMPFLGFYDIWQAIVRSAPSWFYSANARETIENRYSVAFTGARIKTMMLGLLWIFAPALVFAIAMRL